MEDTSPYKRLVSSFGNGHTSTIKQLKKKFKKPSQKADDIDSEEGESHAEIPELRKHEV